ALGKLPVVGDILTGGHGRNVEELGLRAVGRRPVVVAAGAVGAKPLHRLGLRGRGGARIELHVLGWIVVDGLAGLLVDAFGPVDVVHVGFGRDDLAVVALHGVGEAVTRRMRDQLAVLAGDLAVDENVRADLVIVP